MATTEGEFNALAEDLVATLNQFNVPEKERTDLINAVAPLAKDIVEKKGNKATCPLIRPRAVVAVGQSPLSRHPDPLAALGNFLKVDS